MPTCFLNARLRDLQNKFNAIEEFPVVNESMVVLGVVRMNDRINGPDGRVEDAMDPAPVTFNHQLAQRFSERAE